MTTLIIADHNNTQLKSGVTQAVACAQKIGGDIHVLIAGHDCANAAQAAAAISGVTKVIVADAAQYAKPVAENLAPLVVSIAKNYSHLLFPASASGKNTAPRVAAMLDVAQLSDVVAVVSADTFVRPIYAGNAFATVESIDAIKVITVRATGFDAVAATGGNAAIENMDATADSGLSKVIKQELTKSDRPELVAAKRIVSGGRGMGDGDKYRQFLEPLADKLGAALGASRAAVDAGFVPNDYQVGQTGKVVAPELYIAIGISGAIQHLAGMKDSKVIVAINKDPDAPIFQVADYGLVGDLFTLVPELTAAI
jgi:electron transfer flavoprotein alpha subunit